jgi:hypothetical protein
VNGTHVQSIARVKGLAHGWHRVTEILSLWLFIFPQRAIRPVPLFLFRPLAAAIAIIQVVFTPGRARAHQSNVKRALAAWAPRTLGTGSRNALYAGSTAALGTGSGSPLRAGAVRTLGAGERKAFGPGAGGTDGTGARSTIGTGARSALARWSPTIKALTSYGYFLLEYFKAHSLQRVSLLDSFEFHGLEEVDRALERGRGVILPAVHLGNWWAGAAALALAGYPTHIVAGVQFTEAISDHAKTANESWGMRVVSPGPGQYRRLITALRDNEVIALPVDGDIFERGIEVPFFSGVVRAPSGPARLAAMTGAAVVACRVIRTAPMRFRFEFDTVWEGSRPGDMAGDSEPRAPAARHTGTCRPVTMSPSNPDDGNPTSLMSSEVPSGTSHVSLKDSRERGNIGRLPHTSFRDSEGGRRRPRIRSEEQSQRSLARLPHPEDPGFVRELTLAIMSEQERAIGLHLDQWCIFRDLWSYSGDYE